MNVLILTPDRVGSTLLQRLITIYMLRKGFDRPVINLHELSNGLIKYYNSLLNQEVLGKPEGTGWGYFQSLPEIIELLKSVNHYKTSRLAHYHLICRNDSVNEQLKFYEYLNQNFYIISCRRQNLLEHALSWAIKSHSKVLNVYDTDEKINHFSKIYQNGIHVEQISLRNYLFRYKNYINWVDNNFNVQSYFDYDTNIKDIENYILNLDFMAGHANNTWHDMFGQSWQDWNACHRLLPNLVLDNKASSELTIEFNKTPMTETAWKKLQGISWPDNWQDITQAPQSIQQEIATVFNTVNVPVTQEQKQFLEQNLLCYKKTVYEIDKLRENGFMVTGVPIKLQSLAEKQRIIKNFDQCVEWYNSWVEKNNFGSKYDIDTINQIAVDEEQQLNRSLLQSIVHSKNKLLGSD